MAASVEVRVPLLDHRIVEFAPTMAADVLIRGHRQKYVLKARGTADLSGAVVDRTKACVSDHGREPLLLVRK